MKLLYSSASKKTRVSPRLVSHAEYVVGGSDDGGQQKLTVNVIQTCCNISLVSIISIKQQKLR